MKKNVIIDLKHISVKLGDNQVLDDLSLYIRDRESRSPVIASITLFLGSLDL